MPLTVQKVTDCTHAQKSKDAERIERPSGRDTARHPLPQQVPRFRPCGARRATVRLQDVLAIEGTAAGDVAARHPLDFGPSAPSVMVVHEHSWIVVDIETPAHQPIQHVNVLGYAAAAAGTDVGVVESDRLKRRGAYGHIAPDHRDIARGEG